MAEKLKVMVVDDEKSIRTTLRSALEDMGLEVCTAASGEEAVGLSEREDLSLVMLDLRLPGMDGLEVLSRLRERTPAPPVVIISAHGTVGAAASAMHMGAVDFLQKPFTLDEVKCAVEEVLSRQGLDEKATDYASLTGLARRAMTMKNADLAESLASRALSADAARPEAFDILGVIADMRGDRVRALKFYRAALDMDPKYGPARAHLEQE